MSQLAKLLGQRGIWVDQLTTLDPHPVAEFGDVPVQIFEMFFLRITITRKSRVHSRRCEPITNSYNRRLSLPGGYGDVLDSNHSDTHLWYHGTIDYSFDANDGQVTLGDSLRLAWYPDLADELGQTTGFYYSRVGRATTATGRAFPSARPPATAATDSSRDFITRGISTRRLTTA